MTADTSALDKVANVNAPFSRLNPGTTSGGETVALPIEPGVGLPVLPPSGLYAGATQEVRGGAVIRQGRLAPGPDLKTYAFAKVEFVGNLFRIPLH